MRQIISQFIQLPLEDAVSGLLSKLGIKYKPLVKGIPFDEYFEQKDFTYQYVTEARSCLEHIWNIGYVTDETLQGQLSSDEVKYKTLSIFACEVKPDAHFPRSIAVALTRAFNRLSSKSVNYKYDLPVIVLFKQGNLLSIATCDRTNRKDGIGDKVGKVTMLRNINCNNLHAGHKQILDRIATDVKGCSSFDELQVKWFKSFSIDVLSDNFFEGYKTIYEDILEYVTGKRMVKEKGKWVERNNSTPCADIMASFSAFADPEKAVRDYVKNLMGRLVFIQFLQKKGWMGVPSGDGWIGGDPEFLQHLFEKSNKKETFVDDVLEPLFNDLNTKRHGDLVTNQNVGVNIKVPYLNGGLFQMDASDDAQFPLPSHFLKGLFDFFSSYNFTIDENAPDDVEIGVDPEMLGRIFENLLEDNKEKGAFYTPKEIVHYMCRESLIAYLSTCVKKNSPDTEDAVIEKYVRSLVEEPEIIIPRMNADQFDRLGNYIRNVRICDPAIGSGAFPMGLLNELVRIRVVLKAWAKDDYDNLLVGDYAALKAEIICNNIYGVDIEKGAIDIARLRFWLSIIVDETIPHALPNFDYKFMQGNSLITTFNGEYVNLDTKTQKHDKVIEMNKEKLALYNLKKKYYSAQGNVKHELAIEIKKSILRLVSMQIGYELRSWYQKNVATQGIIDFEGEQKVSFAEIKKSLPKDKLAIVNAAESLYKQISDSTIDVAKRAQKDINFFDWRMMFTEVFDTEDGNGGFDIVIGNPPYVDIKGMPREEVNRYFNLFTTCENRINLYSIFIEKGLALLSKDGTLSYINPNSMLVNESYTKLRRVLVDGIKLIVKLPDSVFTDAVVETIIFMFKKNNKEENVRTSFLKNNDNVDLSLLEYTNHSRLSWKEEEICRFNIFIDSKIAKLLSKVQNNTCPLSNYVLTSLGITPYDKAKGHSQELIKSRAFHSSTKLDATYVPLISGKNISPYCITSDTDEYLKYGEWLGAPREKRFFTAPRIVVRQIVGGNDLRIIAGYEDIYPTFFTQIGFSLISKNNDVRELKYLLCLLNSKLLSFYHKNKFLDPEKVVFQKILIANAKLFPIKMAADINPFVNLVDSILEQKRNNSQADITSYQCKIDELIYQLYELTADEVLLVEGK